ncbi:MAG: hypothetical protein HRT88_05140 [Lentisphaeraceae bacterium]|nr:hypothetical protein [Lentisphaeraceae bacterium]
MPGGKIREFLTEYIPNYQQDMEFFYGLAAALFFYIIIRICLWMMLTPKCRGVYIPGDNGTLFVSTHAIEDFVIRALAERDEMIIERVKLSQKGKQYSISIVLKVSGDTNVHELRPLIEERILKQIKSRIGIDNLNTINIELKNFSAKDSQINRRHKLAMKEFDSKKETASE